MNTLPMQSTTLQYSLNRLFRGYNLSEIGENEDKIQRAEIFDDYLILSEMIKQLPKQE
ncbi:MAG: hypothetical protein MUF58_07465 [Arcicella sp.]|jgi:hypothetical protein|nr:hypothetical protein [Arcicella sp.]